MVMEAKDILEAIGKSLQPARPWQYIAFHGTLDLLVVAAIWFVPWPQSDHDG